MHDRQAPGTVASRARMMFRGVTRHCPRCGSGNLFARWFTMVEACPRCGYLFAREEGFFLGAFVINFGATIAGLAVIMGILIVVLAGSGSPHTFAIVALGAVVECLVVPVVFYPFSKTLWSAIDLVMHRGEIWSAVPDAAGFGAR